MRVDPALLITAAPLLGALVAVRPAASLAAAALLGLMLTPRVRPLVLLAGLLALALGAARAKTAIASFEAARIEAREALDGPRRCAGTGIVETSPALRGDRLFFVAEFSALDCEGRPVGPTRVRLYGGPPTVTRGSRVRVTAQLAPMRLFRNADLLDPTPRAARSGATLSGGVLALEQARPGRGLRAAIDRARAHARRRIQAGFAPSAAPMARALVLGENDLSPEDDEAFRLSGLAHLLAVSGTHLVFAVVAVVRALTFVLVRVESLAARFDVGRFAAGLGAALALLYADFAGGSGSAWRAAWMLAAAFSVRALGRRARAGRALALSLGVGAAADPLAAYDISFMLSVAATCGLIAIGQPLARPLSRLRSGVARFVGTAVIATVSSMVPCAPLLAMLGPTLTAAGVVANVFAMPFGEVIALPLCLLHPLTSSLPLLEAGAAQVASGALLVVRRVAHESASTTALAFAVPMPHAWHFAVLGVGATGIWLAGRRGAAAWTLCSFAALVGVERATIDAGRPRGAVRVTALDVGQGDATLIDLPDGRALLIDGGGFVGSSVDPGERILLPLLRARRRSELEIVAISHPHPDHFGGLLTLFARLPVRQVWVSGQGQVEGASRAYERMLADLARRRIIVRTPADLCGRPKRLGAATLEVLGPCPKFVPGKSPNDNSVVLRLFYRGRAALFVGDAERDQEARLMRRHGERLRADFLKVGHHGSRTSTSPDFVRAIAPRLATISCGVRNRFGHPHPETLETLGAFGTVVLRLDRTGSVEWWTDGDRDAVRIFARSL